MNGSVPLLGIGADQTAASPQVLQEGVIINSAAGCLKGAGEGARTQAYGAKADNGAGGVEMGSGLVGG